MPRLLAECNRVLAPGGLILHKNPTLVGITDFGDTNALANSYIDGFTGAAATSGIAVNPS